MNKLNRLKRIRLELGLKQFVVAKQANIRQPLLSDFENGKLIPGPEMQARLAKALNVPADWLFAPDV
jgi:transcriptional regulator with XRE-family HTH domain